MTQKYWMGRLGAEYRPEKGIFYIVEMIPIYDQYGTVKTNKTEVVFYASSRAESIQRAATRLNKMRQEFWGRPDVPGGRDEDIRSAIHLIEGAEVYAKESP